MSNTRTNQEWLRDLKASGAVQEAAIADLRALLLRAALYFFSRNLDDFKGLARDEILQCAEDCAQDALIATMDHLPDFRGDSKFSTWAYKFAINIALRTARRERWKNISLDELIASSDGNFFRQLTEDHSDGIAPERTVMQAEVQQIIQEVIEHELTEKQRQVLVLMVLHEVPLDEVVRHFGTNRNAVYKMLHDARRKLKSGLMMHGLEVDQMLTLFGSSK